MRVCLRSKSLQKASLICRQSVGREDLFARRGFSALSWRPNLTISPRQGDREQWRRGDGQLIVLGYCLDVRRFPGTAFIGSRIGGCSATKPDFMRRHLSAPPTAVPGLLSLWVVLVLVFSLCPDGTMVRWHSCRNVINRQPRLAPRQYLDCPRQEHLENPAHLSMRYGMTWQSSLMIWEQ